MKWKIILCALSILTGITLAIPVFFFHPSSIQSCSFYVLQVGAFTSYENALEKQHEIEDSIIFFDQNYYLVFVGASTSRESIEKVKGVLDEKQVAYFEKELVVDSNHLEDFQYYTLLLEKAQEKETILFLNKTILENMVNI